MESIVRVHMYNLFQSTFETGNQIMLVSRTSGRALRILRTKADKLKVDGRGAVTRQEWNGCLL